MAWPGAGTTESAGHDFLDHTSEVTLKLWAGSFPGLLSEAAVGLSEWLTRSTPRVTHGEPREISLTAKDRESLLVAWLNELVFFGEAESWLVAKVDIEATETRLVARAEGIRLDRPAVGVKAATFHGLSLRRTDRGWEAEVTLDV
jgi:SHS2 domain-containing protein